MAETSRRNTRGSFATSKVRQKGFSLRRKEEIAKQDKARKARRAKASASKRSSGKAVARGTDARVALARHAAAGRGLDRAGGTRATAQARVGISGTAAGTAKVTRNRVTAKAKKVPERDRPRSGSMAPKGRRAAKRAVTRGPSRPVMRRFRTNEA